MAYKGYATAAQLCEVFGPHWAICRNTENNRARYGRCITSKEYDRVSAKLLAGTYWKECGCCGGEHPAGYTGDCRNDAMRRTHAVPQLYPFNAERDGTS